MQEDIWQKCNGAKQLQLLERNPWRVVEAQHINSTRHLVGSNKEHELLEQMIDRVKPVMNEQVQQDYHYLLFTPFRYPPLKHGSRFGQRHEPSIWYGALSINTAFAETAYYRFMFLQGTTAELGTINSLYNGFQAVVKTPFGVDLTISQFDNHRSLISSPCEYSASQHLGSCMRASGVKAFIYYSVRDPDQGKSIGLFSVETFAEKKRLARPCQTWQCNADKEAVEFSRVSITGREVKCFELNDFLIDGVLPEPAP